MEYKRSAFHTLQQRLARDEILLLIGPRQVGKTVLLKQLEKNTEELNQLHFFLNLEDPQFVAMLNDHPKNIFRIFPIPSGTRSFLFIDEIQYLEKPTNFLKYMYDEYRETVKITASGSSAFYLDRKFTDSLAGRKHIATLYTLSFREFLQFKHENTLASEDFSHLTLSQTRHIIGLFREYLIYGGYPKVVLSQPEEKQDVLRELAYSYIKKDILESGIRRDELMYKLFTIISAQPGSLVNSSELANTLGVSKTAVDHYLYVAQKSFHLALVRPFYRNIRKELTKMPRAYFIDTGLRNFFINDFRLPDMRPDTGFLLEQAVFRQLLDRYDISSIRFWRTTDGHEVDFVIEDQLLAYEVKRSENKVRKRRYAQFQNSYPDISLQFVTLDTVWML